MSKPKTNDARKIPGTLSKESWDKWNNVQRPAWMHNFRDRGLLSRQGQEKGVNRVMKTVTARTDFTLNKAVYCTCWDNNIIFTVKTAGDDISVATRSSQ